MIVTAQIECKWCGEKITIPRKETTRSFNITFNKLKRHHDWHCESDGKRKEQYDNAKRVASDVIKKIMT